MYFGVSLVVQWLRLYSQIRVPVWIPGQGTRSHMPQLRMGTGAQKGKTKQNNIFRIPTINRQKSWLKWGKGMKKHFKRKIVQMVC